jgi:dihydrofolate reductase
MTVVASMDGFIARHSGEKCDFWGSSGNRALFHGDLEAADWTIIGRQTHEANPRPERRRVVFTSSDSVSCNRPTQVCVDPSGLEPADLARIVEPVRPMRRALIVGGTRVYDWFRSHDAIDRVHLTIEPVCFNSGLAIFSDLPSGGPLRTFAKAGYEPVYDRPINEKGTRFLILEPDGPAPH